MSQPYSWQQPYLDAVLETDHEKLAQVIAYAEWVIDLRLNETREMAPDESAELSRTLTALSILKTERISREWAETKS